ncbi:hypothetical protein PPSIR1_16960 [Plesiocystis pacifica SIR-1]|uniref:Lipoprotein n=1 Tax=Plesiocystis pacifica SIR-1 TaxID=391625 RepID=A6GGI5_9BACT|nr:hypothetical protein [Plesiocystis pacifica]EDM75011.1 hypothetical protein PPSIR1_16960 [Plesiocystis pacifica SIR-1]
MSRSLELPTLCLASIFSLGLSACGVDVCPEGPPPEGFGPVAEHLPAELVFCAAEDSGAVPDPVNQAHVNFRVDSNDIDAGMQRVVEWMRASGWSQTDDWAADLAFTRDGTLLRFSAFSNPRSKSFGKSDRFHAFVSVEPAP